MWCLPKSAVLPRDNPVRDPPCFDIVRIKPHDATNFCLVLALEHVRNPPSAQPREVITTQRHSHICGSVKKMNGLPFSSWKAFDINVLVFAASQHTI